MADDKANKLFDKFWTWRLKESPEFASYCGSHDNEGTWDDISEEAYLRREETLRILLAEAEALDVRMCSKSVQDSMWLLVDDIKKYIRSTKFKSYLLPINIGEGFHNELNHQLGFHDFNSIDGFEKYIKRLKAMPLRILQIIPLLKKAIEEGVVMHKFSIGPVCSQLDTMIKQPAEESILIAPFLKTDTCLSEESRTRLKGTAVKELENIRGSLKELKENIEKEYLPHTRPSEGLSSLQNGTEFYQECLRYHISCDLTPQEVHDIGLKEVARIRKQMLEISNKEGFADDLKAFQQKLHTSEEFKFHSADEVLEYVNDICFNKIRPKLSEVFHRLTDIPLIIRGSPASQSASYSGFYSSGTADKSRPGVYLLNANNLNACKKYDFMALSLHEGEPGHHFQHSTSFSAAVPRFRQYIEDGKYYLAPRYFGKHTAYIEGWGLYSESLGEELGLYTDNYTLFGRYSFEMLRAARLVVDTGLHALGWNQQQATQYLVETTLKDEPTMRNEVNRYISVPGQACAYKIGEMKLWDLRRKAQKELGFQFDVRDFHEAVLECGPSPLTFLEAFIDDYIKDVKCVDEDNQKRAGSPAEGKKSKA